MARSNDPLDVLPGIKAGIEGSSRPSQDHRLFNRLLEASSDLFKGDASTLDLKIASTALEEMTKAFNMFAPYRDSRKVTIFGSARTTPDNPIYGLTAKAAHVLTKAGFMTVTGAGPGIMEAGMLGAGRENSIGVSIRLPFEQGANSVIAGDAKYVSMRYFFTRKLMLVKESHAFLCLPGGFGTLDETFELLTLAQTAKSVPVPIVFLEVQGDPFWTPLMSAMEPLLLSHGLISHADTSLYRITDSIDEAVEEIVGFYNNYHSIRFVDNVMYIRIQREVPPSDFDALHERFKHLTDQPMKQVSATDIEIEENDNVDLHRVRLNYTAKGFAELRPLIDALNRY